MLQNQFDRASFGSARAQPQRAPQATIQARDAPTSYCAIPWVWVHELPLSKCDVHDTPGQLREKGEILARGLLRLSPTSDTHSAMEKERRWREDHVFRLQHVRLQLMLTRGPRLPSTSRTASGARGGHITHHCDPGLSPELTRNHACGCKKRRRKKNIWHTQFGCIAQGPNATDSTKSRDVTPYYRVETRVRFSELTPHYREVLCPTDKTC